jgi:egghead protein (zeste-white 4 protein)
MVYFFIRFIQNFHKYKRVSLNPIPIGLDKKIIFQICSKNAPPIVDDVINRIHQVCLEVGYKNYEVNLLIDNNQRGKTFSNANVVMVPPSYRTRMGSKYKARALQYAIEERRRQGMIDEKLWIYLLDEESFVTRQTVISLMKYVHAGGAPISEGPITYPNKFFETNILCAFGEAQRPYICYDCVTQMQSPSIPLHMHGSNLLVRSDIEEKVGWDFYKVDASEDQRFGWEAVLKLGKRKNFGWHGGVLEEQPAFALRDYIKQRQRWFVGNLHNLMYAKVPLRTKVLVGLRWFSWSAGFIAGLTSIVALLIPHTVPDVLAVPLLFNAGIWLLGYQIGLYHIFDNMNVSWAKKVAYHLFLLVLTFVVGLIETFAAFTAPVQLRHFVREPTPKVSYR